MIRLKEKQQFLPFILPAIAYLLAVKAFPTLNGIYVSFTDLNFLYPGVSFVGFENYRKFLDHPDTPRVAVNTILFIGTVTLLQVSLGLGAAVLLNRGLAGTRLVRSIAIMPWIIPPVIIAVMFQQMFNGSKLGLMNSIIALFGQPPHAWLSSPGEAMAVMILTVAWRGLPLSIILQLGALQTVSKELVEAAIVDGAGRWQRFRHVVLPTIRPILLINVIMVTSGTLNHIDIPLKLTGGGPDKATEVLALTMYLQGFDALDAGYASTLATLILLLNLGLTAVYIRILRSRHSQDA
jgi:ABC-type sugar transport system permease subunit